MKRFRRLKPIRVLYGALALAVVMIGGQRLAAQSPPEVEGAATDVPLDPKKHYPAEPWYRTHAQLIESWADVVKTKPDEQPGVDVRWAISALALYHAARVSAGPAAGEWRKVARSKADRLVVAEKFAIDKQNRKVLLTSAKLDEKFKHVPLNYGVPFVLLLSEHLAAGIDSGRVPDRANLADFQKHDRDPITSLGSSPDWSRERLSLTLMLLWMSVDGGTAPSTAVPFKNGLLATEGVGWSQVDPGATGSVLLGMQSAMNLGLLEGCRKMQAAGDDLLPACHKAGGDGAITYDEFRSRWSDTLMHAITTICFGSVQANDASWIKSDGLFNRRELKGDDQKVAPRLWQQAYYYKTRDGRLERKLFISPAPEAVDGRPVYARTTTAYNGTPYQTASCGYVLLIASRLLRQILDGAENDKQTVVGTQYRLEWAGSGRGWKLVVSQRHVATLSFGRGRYVGLQVAAAGTGSVARMDDIVDELLTGLVQALYKDRRLVDQSSDAAATNSPYGLFTIGKFFVAAGYPDVVGQYYWHRDFCRRLEEIASTFKKGADDGRCDHEFAILTALQAYQPAYSSTGKASGKSGGK
jgi:hypothetical protein